MISGVKMNFYEKLLRFLFFPANLVWEEGAHTVSTVSKPHWTKKFGQINQPLLTNDRCCERFKEIY